MFKKIMTLALAITLTIASITASADTTRIAGLNRYETAANISQITYDKSKVVVIANGNNYVDALAASTLANILKAPILLTEKETLPEVTGTEILRLGASEAIILGGMNTIEQAIEDKINSLGLVVKRIGGKDRYETSELILDEIKSLKDIKKVAIAANVPDAVSSSAYRGDEIPLLLINGANPSEKISLLTEEKVVLGGVNSVSEEVYNKIGANSRISGNDRFNTALELAKLNTELRETKDVLLVNGYEFVDAFTVASYAFVRNVNILLVESTHANEKVKTFIEESKSNVTLIGGVNVIVDDVLEAEKPLPEPEPEPDPEPQPEPEPDPEPQPEPEPEPGKIDPNKPMIAVTYDDGPNFGSTERILNVLKQNNAKATFFVLGDRIPSRESILQRQIAEGHEIGNHSYGHPNLTRLGYAAIQSQISRTQDAVYNATGIYPKLARPTYGAVNQNVKDAVFLPLVNWSVDTRDWESRNPNSIYNIIMNNVKDGDIILMHDIHEPTATASEMVIPKLVEKGFQLVTLSELFQYKGITPTAGNLYFHAR